MQSRLQSETLIYLQRLSISLNRIMQTSFNQRRLWELIISIYDRLILSYRSLLIQGTLYRTTEQRDYSWVIMMPFLPALV